MEYIAFKHPFTCLISGPTGSGKTYLLRRILASFKDSFTPNMNALNVLWIHGQVQHIHMIPIGPGVKTRYIHFNGESKSKLQTIVENEISIEKPDVIVVDDLMGQLKADKFLEDLFTKKSHHLNISVFLLVQYLFVDTDVMRTISRNCHYIILLKSVRDRLQIMTLARQIFPGKSKFFMDAYEDAMNKSYNNIRLDLTPGTPDNFRFQTKYLPEDWPIVIYKPKNV